MNNTPFMKKTDAQEVGAVVAETSQEQTDSMTPMSNRLRLIDVIDRLYQGKEVFFHYIQTVGDVMSMEVKALTLEHKLADALRLIDEHGVRHFPIVDEERPEVLIGVVSQRDLARGLSRGVGTLAQTDTDNKMLNQPLGTVVTRNPRTVTPDTSILEAVQLMVDEKFDFLPVVVGPEEEQEVVGVLTTTDIIKCFLRMEVLRKAREMKPKALRLIDFVKGQSRNQPSELLIDALMGRVDDIMEDKKVVTVTVEESIERALFLMQEHRIRHLPVLDPQGRLRGILSDRDVLAFLPPQRKKYLLALFQFVNKKDILPYEDLESDHGKQDDRPEFRDELFRIGTNDTATRRALSEKVASAMTGSPVTVEPTTPLVEVAEIFISRGFGSLPVVAANDSSLKGIVTQTDFLRAILALGRLLASGDMARL